MQKNGEHNPTCVYSIYVLKIIIITFLKEILSGEIMEDLEDREADLEDGRETVAVTAVAMVAMPMPMPMELEQV